MNLHWLDPISSVSHQQHRRRVLPTEVLMDHFSDHYDEWIQWWMLLNTDWLQIDPTVTKDLTFSTVEFLQCRSMNHVFLRKVLISRSSWGEWWMIFFRQNRSVNSFTDMEKQYLVWKLRWQWLNHNEDLKICNNTLLRMLSESEIAPFFVAQTAKWIIKICCIY